jgi:hypothetical protein
MEKEKISFVWWNTSLAPASPNPPDVNDQNFVCELIDLMTETMNIDFIALGELSENDFKYIKSKCLLKGYELKSGISKVGRTTFDTCYIYNNTKLAIFDVKDITTTKGNKTFKVAQKLEVLLSSSNLIFYLFISHWPSRLWYQENHPDRNNLGVRLRDSVDEIIGLNNTDPYIILMGDYNDEPFDKSICEHIMATRDKKLASEKKHLLYNPFWKHLGTNLKDEYHCGSYFYQQGSVTKWLTFDQIIFSHSFLEGKDWKLIETESNILYIPEYIKIVSDKKRVFDHLPVIGLIERVN